MAKTLTALRKGHFGAGSTSPIQQTICNMLRFWRQLRPPSPATLFLRLGCSPQRSLSDMAHEPCPVSLHPSQRTHPKEHIRKGPLH
ncbi:hypothetical protein I7I51_03907 [Histoplasma capsulatum]|uniref:Uncharacterized protein n=1 Tax=Ajellomyces capsulatus TaxID=5037 RepID=A0A8A1M908_AJECA|nr:hypothetical protein I7I51_03907 [Histoplasma capsulatum]